MKKLYTRLCPVVICTICTVTAFSQESIYIGKSSDLVASYKAKATNAKTSSNKITHRVSAQRNLVLRVNLHNTVGDADFFIGSIEKSKGASFVLKAEGKLLTGNIVLPAEKKAYLYVSKKSGDVYLKETDINKIICVNYGEEGAVSELVKTVTAPVNIPILQSLPKAQAVVLLDFDGQYVTGTNWNGGAPINAAPARLTEDQIIEVWKMVSEDFRPFNLNITTSEAVFFNAPVTRRMRVIFSHTRDWYGVAGGVAYVGSFTWGRNFALQETPCWAFRNSSSKEAGEVASHEVGHTLGLSHDGRTTIPHDEYYNGQMKWGPIMGSCYNVAQSQWSKGEYPLASNTEDDLRIITTQNGFTYRTDDHSNTATNATLISTGITGNILPYAKGIITTMADVDVFYFVTAGGPVNIQINPSPASGNLMVANLDIKATLKNGNNIIATSDPGNNSAAINTTLPAGTYHLFIEGAKGAFGADSDYGSLGEYFISGSFLPTGITTCSDTFYDPGNLGNYANNLNVVQTFTPATPGSRLRFTFTSFDLSTSNDLLYVFDGATTGSPLIGVYSGTSSPGTVTATNDAGKLTFRFVSDASISAPGWQASIACVPPLTVQWNRRFGGTGTENATAIIRTSDGGYLVGGYSTSGIGGDKTEASRGANDYWVVKLSGTGIKQWDKRFGGTGDDLLVSLVQTTDGGFLLGGTSASAVGGDRTQASRGDEDYWIVKISSTGAKQWDKGFGTSYADELANVINTSDGGYLLTGYTAGVGGDKTEGSRGGIDYWVVKVNSTGQKQWDRRFGSTLGDKAQAAVQATDGGYLIAGYSNSPATGDKSESNRGSSFTSDYWVVKLSATGTKQWDKRFGGAGNETLSSVIATNDGGYLLSGSSQSDQNGDKSEINRGRDFGELDANGYSPDYWLVKLTGAGQKEWDKTLGGDREDIGSSLIKMTDGSYLAGGYSRSSISGDKTESSRGLEDYWVVNLSQVGTKRWDKRFGGTSTDVLSTLVQATDNGMVLAGQTLSGAGYDKTEPSRGAADYWIIKTTAPFGSLDHVINNPGTTVTTVFRNDTVQEDQPTPPVFTATPNPFHEKVTLRFRVEQKTFVGVSIHDVYGRLVRNLFAQTAEGGRNYALEFNGSHLQPGVYFATLRSKGRLSQLKVILVK